MARRGNEGIGDAAADDQLIHDFGQCAQDRQLRGDFRSTDYRDQRSLRIVERTRKRSKFCNQ